MKKRVVLILLFAHDSVTHLDQIFEPPKNMLNSKSWAGHRKPHAKGQREITLAQSRRLYKTTDIVVALLSEFRHPH